jgi:hypothetical protein
MYDYDYLPFDNFEDDDMFEIETNTKALKAAKKDIEKVMPKPEEEKEVEDNNDDYAKDWIEITDDDGDDDYED